MSYRLTTYEQLTNPIGIHLYLPVHPFGILFLHVFNTHIQFSILKHSIYIGYILKNQFMLHTLST